MKASYVKYLLNFKEPAGTSRGILNEKETWIIQLDDNGKKNNHSVISIKLDSFFSKIKAYPSIIKIDVEGGELNVLKGAKKCLTQAEYVIVEVNEDIHCKKFGYKHDDIHKYLLKLKFKYFYHVSNKDKSVIKSDAFTPGDILFSKKRIVEFDV